jgi:hypothetical protein
LKPIDHGLLERLVIGRPPATPIRTTPESRPARQEEPAERSSGGGRNWLWIAIPICVSCIGAFGRMSRNQNDTDRSDRYVVTSPNNGSTFGRGTPGDPNVPGLTGGQVNLLRGLARRQSLSDAEAGDKASMFQLLGRVGPSFAKANMPDGAWITAPDPTFTTEQQRIQDRLAKGEATSAEQIRLLLIQFVKAGRPAAGGPNRP